MGKFCRTHRGCYSAQFSRSTLLWRDIPDCGCRAALCFVGWVWMLCDNASEPFNRLKRCQESPKRGWCRQSVGVSFLPVLSLGGCSTLRNEEICFPSWTTNMAAKMEQLFDCCAVKFEFLDILTPVELQSLVLTSATLPLVNTLVIQHLCRLTQTSHSKIESFLFPRAAEITFPCGPVQHSLSWSLASATLCCYIITVNCWFPNL